MRYFLISLFVHVLLFSFVWVGFSVSGGHEQNAFTYLGDVILPLEKPSSGSLSDSSRKSSDDAMFENSSSAYFAPWIKMRQLNKPQ